MRKSSFLLGAIAAFGALVTLSSMSQAAVVAGQPIVIKPQAGDQAFYYVNVEAPPWLACRVGQKVFFEMLGQPPFGWKWTVDASSPVMTPLPPSQYPSGHNVVAGYECASVGTGSVTWSWQGPNLPLQQEHLQMKATPAP